MELIDLYRSYPTNSNIAKACAKGMMNATNYFLQVNDKQTANTHFKQLLKVLNEHPGKDMIDTRMLMQLKEYFKL